MNIETVVSSLERFYGLIPAPPRDPFAFFVWHVVGDKATVERREAALAALRRIPALTPDAVFSAPKGKVQAAVTLAGGDCDQRIRTLDAGVGWFRRSRELANRLAGIPDDRSARSAGSALLRRIDARPVAPLRRRARGGAARPGSRQSRRQAGLRRAERRLAAPAGARRAPRDPAGARSRSRARHARRRLPLTPCGAGLRGRHAALRRVPIAGGVPRAGVNGPPPCLCSRRASARRPDVSPPARSPGLKPRARGYVGSGFSRISPQGRGFPSTGSGRGAPADPGRG